MKRKILLLLLCLLMLSFVGVKVDLAEPPVELGSGNFCWLWWGVEAPREIKIGEEFPVIFTLRPMVTLDAEKIVVSVGGCGIDWEYSWENIRMHWEATYTETAYLTITEEHFGAGVWVIISAAYDDAWGEHYHETVEFRIGRECVKTYQEYQDLERELSWKYSSLQDQYNSLETKTRMAMLGIYAFMATTIVFIATTVYFARRKPKLKPE